MNVKTFILYIFLTTFQDWSRVFCRSTYDNPSYNNDRDENLSLLARQKKRLSSDENLHDEQPEEYERSVPVYESQRYRKFDSDAFARHDNRMDKMPSFEENKMMSQKREYFDANNGKDASIEVILDPRAKKAVAVVENTPNGQAMYDLTAWKNNKEENAAYESDQYNPSTQEQVVNLVYPAERNDRKYSNSFDNSDYSEKSKIGFKENIRSEDTHKKKRNADTKKADKENEKRNVQDKSKRKSEKLDMKQNECPPHNTPASVETETNKDNTNEKVQTVKRETSQWSQEQLNALKNSLAHVKNNDGEVQNLKNILSSMGLIEQPQMEKKREAAKAESDEKTLEKRDDNKEVKINNELKSNGEDEDLIQDNIILKRNGRDTNKKEQEEINSAPQEPKEKREAAENNYEEVNDEPYNEKMEVKRSSNDAEPMNLENKDEMNMVDDTQARKKRQNTENNQKLNKEENSDKENIAGAASDVNKYDSSKNFAKRETNSDSSTEIRKNRDNQETEEEYEKRMESQIQAKIDAIKEKVKREILEEQLKRRYKRNQNLDFDNLNTNIRKRRQLKEQGKEESSKTVNSNIGANNEKTLLNQLESQSKVVRRKRANTLPEKQMVYRAYQTDQDEEAEDDSEFDDNGYDGRMYVEKRQVEDENDYYDPVRKREVDNYLRQYLPEPRNRRSYNEGYEEESNAFHGSRRATKNKSFSSKQNQEEFNSKTNENNDNEYFGSLPQTYNGELNRYKRVKRDNPYK